MKTHALPKVAKYMDTETHALSADDDIRRAVGRLIDEGVTGARREGEHGRWEAG